MKINQTIIQFYVHNFRFTIIKRRKFIYMKQGETINFSLNDRGFYYDENNAFEKEFCPHIAETAFSKWQTEKSFRICFKYRIARKNYNRKVFKK